MGKKQAKKNEDIVKKYEDAENNIDFGIHQLFDSPPVALNKAWIEKLTKKE